MPRWTWGALLVGASAIVGVQPLPAQKAGCDRACLTGFMDRYLDALVAHDPARLPTTADVRFTEDGQALELGDGFWGTATARGGYGHVIPDPATGQVAYFGTMRESGDPVLLVARLKVIGGRVSEIETIVPRDNTPMQKAGIAKLEAMARPEEAWDEDLPAGERLPRAELIRIANRYFTGLERNRPNGDYSFFADDCARIENGMETANAKAPPMPPPSASGERRTGDGLNITALPCKAQFATGFYQMVTRIRGRRFAVVDEQKGVVFAFGFFDHAGTVRKETLNDGKTIDVDLKAPFTWEIGEAFKIRGGKIARVEAVMKRAPYGMEAGWDTSRLGYSPRTGPR